MDKRVHKDGGIAGSKCPIKYTFRSNKTKQIEKKISVRIFNLNDDDYRCCCYCYLFLFYVILF